MEVICYDCCLGSVWANTIDPMASLSSSHRIEWFNYIRFVVMEIGSLLHYEQSSVLDHLTETYTMFSFAKVSIF
jgi:hypothetical protein